MIGLESRKILFIEEMAEGAVSDIMQESGESKEFFNIVRRWEFTIFNLVERRIKLLCKDSSHMHGSQGVLKTGMFC
jgi:dTDP-D-glucose 4,6-dehydratase